MDVGNRVGIARADVAMWRMMIGKRPVDEIEIEIVELKVAKGLFAGWNYILFGVLVVPELGSNP